MDKTNKGTTQLHFKKMVLSYAEMCGSDKKAIDLFHVSKSTKYHWKKKYKKGGYKELLRQTLDRSKDPRCVPEETIELVLKLRKEQKNRKHNNKPRRATQKLHKPFTNVEEVLEDIYKFNPKFHLCCILTYGCLLRPHQEIR